MRKLEDRKCAEDGCEYEEGLKDESAADGEGVAATEVASFVQTMDSFQPRRWVWEEIANSGEVVGKDRADGSREQEGKWNRGEGGRAKEDQKNNQGEDLVREGHGEEAGEFGFSVGGGVKPVADARVAVGNGVEGEMAEDGGQKYGNFSSRHDLGQTHAENKVDGGEQGVSGRLWPRLEQRLGPERDQLCRPVSGQCQR